MSNSIDIGMADLWGKSSRSDMSSGKCSETMVHEIHEAGSADPCHETPQMLSSQWSMTKGWARAHR